MYGNVINSLPDRLDEIKDYYNKLEVTDGFGYFICSESTKNAVLGSTDFKNNKTAFNELIDGYGKFALNFDFENYGYLTKDYYDGLVDEAVSVLSAKTAFDSAVEGMQNLGAQAVSLAKSCQMTVDILSTVLMIFNIVLTVILGFYWIALVIMHKKGAA